jgi:hypothetical protein
MVKADSPAVDAGAGIGDNMLDCFNRARPNGSAPDIRAMEFGSAQVECIPRFPAASIWPEPRSNTGFLVQQNTLRDAVVAAANFNVFHKYADRAQMSR